MAVFSRAFGHIQPARVVSARLYGPQAILFLNFCTCQGRNTAPLCHRANHIQTVTDVSENQVVRFSAGLFISQLLLPGNQLFMFGRKIARPQNHMRGGFFNGSRPCAPCFGSGRAKETNQLEEAPHNRGFFHFHYLCWQLSLVTTSSGRPYPSQAEHPSLWCRCRL